MSTYKRLILETVKLARILIDCVQKSPWILFKINTFSTLARQHGSKRFVTTKGERLSLSRGTLLAIEEQRLTSSQVSVRELQ